MLPLCHPKMDRESESPSDLPRVAWQGLDDGAKQLLETEKDNTHHRIFCDTNRPNLTIKNMLNPCKERIVTQLHVLHIPSLTPVQVYLVPYPSIPVPPLIVRLDCSHGASHLNRVFGHWSDLHRALGNALVVHATTSRLGHSRANDPCIICSWSPSVLLLDG